jgi:hypothetical protein
MHVLQKLGMLCAALAVASCAPVQPKFVDISIPPERISQMGYSLVPLNEKGWLIAVRSFNILALVKLGGIPEENFVIRASLYQLPAFKTNEEFVHLVKEAQAKGGNPERLKTMKHEVVTFAMKGIDCAKSYMVIEDHGAAKRVGKTGVMVQETLTLDCAHPKRRNIGVSVLYSQRNYPGQGDPRFLEKGTSLFNSVEFVDL